MCVIHINAVITEVYVAFYVQRLFCTDSVKIYTEYLQILRKYSLLYSLKVSKLFSTLSSKIFIQISAIKIAHIVLQYSALHHNNL